MDIKKSCIFVFLLLIPFYLTATGQKDKTPANMSNAAVMTFTDSRGTLIELDSAPEKVISLGPNITETIYALNREALLVGRTEYCNYPQEVSEVPSIGTLIEPSIETIVSLNPDLVIGSTHVNPEALEKLESLGIKTALIYGEESFEGVKEVISGCAALLDADQKGEEIIADMNARLKAVEKEVSLRKSSPKVYYALGFGDGGDWTAGGNTFISELMTLAGGINIAADQEGWSFSKELLVDKQPQIVFLNQGMKKEFTTLPLYKDLQASIHNMVFEINENTLVRQGPRQIEALEELSSIMAEYPADSE